MLVRCLRQSHLARYADQITGVQDKSEGVFVGRDPPDFDPDDDKPLPRKVPKYESFAYYLGNDLAEQLPKIAGKVDILIVAPLPEV